MWILVCTLASPCTQVQCHVLHSWGVGSQYHSPFPPHTVIINHVPRFLFRCYTKLNPTLYLYIKQKYVSFSPILPPALIGKNLSLSMNLFSCIRDCIADNNIMATFTALMKILSPANYCNTKIATELSESVIPQKFSAMW